MGCFLIRTPGRNPPSRGDAIDVVIEIEVVLGLPTNITTSWGRIPEFDPPLPSNFLKAKQVAAVPNFSPSKRSPSGNRVCWSAVSERDRVRSKGARVRDDVLGEGQDTVDVELIEDSVIQLDLNERELFAKLVPLALIGLSVNRSLM